MIESWLERMKVVSDEKIITSSMIQQAMQDEINELRAKLAELEHELENAQDWKNAFVTLKDRMAELEADAARYRWIVDQITSDSFDVLERAFAVFGDADGCTKGEFDTAIDLSIMKGTPS